MMDALFPSLRQHDLDQVLRVMAIAISQPQAAPLGLKRPNKVLPFRCQIITIFMVIFT